MVRGEPSAADVELIGSLAAAGLAASPAQLERWRAAGLLPSHTRVFLGRGRGSASRPSPEAAALARALAERSQRGTPIEQVTLRLFFERPDLAVDERPLRRALLWYDERRENSAATDAAAAIQQVRSRGGSTDEEEDAAADAIRVHYTRLPRRTRAALERFVPRAEDFALMAVRGPLALGDAAVEAIPVGSEDDDLGLALQSAIRNELLADESDEGGSVNPVFDMKRRRRLLATASLDRISAARDALHEVAEFVRLVQFLLVAVPEDPEAGNWGDVFGSMSLLTILCAIFPPDGLSDPLDWDLGTKLVIAQLVSDGFHRDIVALSTMFGRHAPDLWERLARWLDSRGLGEEGETAGAGPGE